MKQRAYDEANPASTQSARLALRTALSIVLRLLAPFLPYSAEEAWSWWHTESVHTSPWPAPVTPVSGDAGDSAEVISLASAAIGAIRKAKSDAKRSMRAPVETVNIQGPAAKLDAIASISSDLRAAGNVTTLQLEPGRDHELRIDVRLAEE